MINLRIEHYVSAPIDVQKMIWIRSVASILSPSTEKQRIDRDLIHARCIVLLRISPTGSTTFWVAARTGFLEVKLLAVRQVKVERLW